MEGRASQRPPSWDTARAARSNISPPSPATRAPTANPAARNRGRRSLRSKKSAAPSAPRASKAPSRKGYISGSTSRSPSQAASRAAQNRRQRFDEEPICDSFYMADNGLKRQNICKTHGNSGRKIFCIMGLLFLNSMVQCYRFMNRCAPVTAHGK